MVKPSPGYLIIIYKGKIMKITASKVSTNNRLNFLPKYFGRWAMLAENYTFDFLRAMCEQYKGGFWEFYELSNGSLYLAPVITEELYIQSWGNHFEGHVSADAAGIIATLITLNALCVKTSYERFLEYYEKLLDFTESHEESRNIFAGID